MSNLKFPEWLRIKYRTARGYENTRFGDLARNLSDVIRTNEFDEDFDSYDTLEGWLGHLKMHVAPQTVESAMVEAWESYVNEGLAAEVDFIKGDEDEST